MTKVSIKEKRDYGLFKKMFLQIAICLVIYFIFYLVQNSNYIFSEGVLEKTKQVLSYDIDIGKIYEQTMNFVSQQMEQINQEAKQETNSLQDNIDQNVVKNEVENQDLIQENNGVGGAELENVIMENTIITSTSQQEPISQTDDEYIKCNFSFVKPIEGIVSSEFGQRDSSNPIVSKNHTGIDIAAKTGTVIRSSMEGTVTISSTEGDYGYHIKITNNDVSTLYAHCSKLYVGQGEKVVQGQEIAEVGSTGKSTGPHLHFEIMRNSTYINPRNILQF